MISPDSSQSSSSSFASVPQQEDGHQPPHRTTPPPPYAFATHLLGALGPVKRKHQQTLREVEGLVTLIRSRATAEEEMAKQLERMVEVYNCGGTGGLAGSLLRLKPGGGSLDRSGGKKGGHGEQNGRADITSTFRECVESFKADFLKKAGQRREFTQHLLKDVYAPLQELHEQAAAESVELDEEAAGLAKELKAVVKKYEESHRAFARASEKAAVLVQQVVGQGLPAPTADSRRVAEAYSQQLAVATETAATGLVISPSVIGVSSGGGRIKGFAASSPFADLSASSPAARKLASLSSNLIHQVSRADATSWLLSSATNTNPSTTSLISITTAPDLLITQAQQQLEDAELCRLACLDHHADLVDGARGAAHALQVILSRYQLLEEGCVDALSKLLRQAVVFEASCLANEQYEARTTFKAAESVSKERDIEAFIAAQLLQQETKNAGTGGTGAQDAEAALLAVVLRSLGLPLPPSPPPASSLTTTTTTKPQAAAVAVVLQPHSLPNLSAPAPNVVPARYVLRLLRGCPLTSLVPSPPPTALSSAQPATTTKPPSLAPLALRSPVAAATATATVTATAPMPTSPVPVVVAARASPPPGRGPSRPAVVDEDDEEEDNDEEEEDEEEDDDGRATVTRSPLPQPSRPVQQRQQQPPHRSLKELVQKRHEKQRASGAISPLVDLEEIETEGGGKEYLF